MSFNNIQNLTDPEFDAKVGRSHQPVVIDFWAPWCEPCKLISVILEKLALKYDGQVRFLRMNVDEERDKPTQFAIRSIPTLLFFKQGEIANQIIGVHTEEVIDKAIESLL